MAEQKAPLLTQEGLEKLKQEIAELQDRIPEITERISKAKDLGDLSENAEYHEARETMAFTKGSIDELSNVLNKAVIIKKQAATATIDIGSTMKIRSSKGREVEYTIVGSNEANPMQGKISNESPLAQSFLGKKKGDQVTVKTPGGEVLYTILEVK